MRGERSNASRCSASRDGRGSYCSGMGGTPSSMLRGGCAAAAATSGTAPCSFSFKEAPVRLGCVATSAARFLIPHPSWIARPANAWARYLPARSCLQLFMFFFECLRPRSIYLLYASHNLIFVCIQFFLFVLRVHSYFHHYQHSETIIGHYFYL